MLWVFVLSKKNDSPPVLQFVFLCLWYWSGSPAQSWEEWSGRHPHHILPLRKRLPSFTTGQVATCRIFLLFSFVLLLIKDEFFFFFLHMTRASGCLLLLALSWLTMTSVDVHCSTLLFQHSNWCCRRSQRTPFFLSRPKVWRSAFLMLGSKV